MNTPEGEGPNERTGIWRVAHDALSLAAGIAHRASHDDLTGLLTQSAFEYEVEERLKGDEAVGVLLMDMDGFKRVNDELGHQRGNEILRDFGHHLLKHYRREDDVVAYLHAQGQEEKTTREEAETKPQATAGRLGGDEFGIVVSVGNKPSDRRHKSPYEQMKESANYHKKVVRQFVEAQPEEIKRLEFGISIGTAISGKGLIESADKAMYRVKNGR
jgi:GGDEF domain-containing protein